MKSYVLSHGRDMGERISFLQTQSCLLACTQFSWNQELLQHRTWPMIFLRECIGPLWPPSIWSTLWKWSAVTVLLGDAYRFFGRVISQARLICKSSLKLMSMKLHIFCLWHSHCSCVWIINDNSYASSQYCFQEEQMNKSHSSNRLASSPKNWHF